MKTHGSVSCNPRKGGMHVQSEYIQEQEKSRFSRKCSSVISNSIGTKFTMEGPSPLR